MPVTSTNSVNTVATLSTATSTSRAPVVTLQSQIQEQLPELARPKVVEPPKPLDPVLTKPYDWKSDDHYLSKSIVPELAPPPLVILIKFSIEKFRRFVFIYSQPPSVDVSEIISQRLNAMRKLQENPTDHDASKVLFETQQNMSQWVGNRKLAMRDL